LIATLNNKHCTVCVCDVCLSGIQWEVLFLLAEIEGEQLKIAHTNLEEFRAWSNSELIT